MHRAGQDDANYILSKTTASAFLILTEFEGEENVPSALSITIGNGKATSTADASP